jgi:hypothetical protein
MAFPHTKEVGHIGLTNQPCKRSKILGKVIPKGKAMAHLVLSASFAYFIIWTGLMLLKEF